MAAAATVPRFAVCVANEGTDDLTTGMLYRILDDEEARTENLLRVIDDSGEDYLYPAPRFVLIQAPETEVPKLLAAAAVNVI